MASMLIHNATKLNPQFMKSLNWDKKVQDLKNLCHKQASIQNNNNNNNNHKNTKKNNNKNNHKNVVNF
ncbi:hypothetical protein DOY81_001161 [Sarcophaga bullata]|nr:hypothetical protein DOY81_001161 [Sarcophaga bullata]